MALRLPVRAGGSDIPWARPGHPPEGFMPPQPETRLLAERSLRGYAARSWGNRTLQS